MIVAFIIGYNLCLRPVENNKLEAKNVTKENDPNSKCKKCNCKIKVVFKRVKNRKKNNFHTRFILSSEKSCCCCIILY